MNTLPHLTQLHDPHLTDAQLFTLLDEPESADAALQTHLAACADCRTELSTVRTSLTNFRAAATSLASAQRSQQRVIVPARAYSFRRFVWSASLAAAAVVFAASVSLVHPGAHVDTPVATTVPVTASNVEDEALLDGIQQDLSTSIPPSLAPLAVPAVANSTNTTN